MAIIETIGCGVTAPSTTETLATFFPGNTNVVRNCAIDTDIRILDFWKKPHGVGGMCKMISPRLHDNVQGIRFTNGISTDIMHAAEDIYLQKVKSQDQLSVYLTGAAGAGELELAYVSLWYADLAGVNGRFLNYTDFVGKFKNMIGFEIAITSNNLLDWSGARSITAIFDTLKANTDYAILGATSTLDAGAVRFISADTANLGLAIPTDISHPELSRDYFAQKSKLTGLPCIPIFNSANKDNTFVDISTDENVAIPVITMFLAELG